ncbi:hypothetical protein TWF506_002085 [Arthrobotrys conoides]|uniref:Uncharacterized protein n=1 Tax=Arthrobotrys conoides TaxID=74498 RepID=A0AAN8RRT3_9PEZI
MSSIGTPFVFSGGPIPVKGVAPPPAIAATAALPLPLPLPSAPKAIIDDTTSESDNDSIFSSKSDDTNITLEFYTIGMTLYYPIIPFIGQVQSRHELRLLASFYDIQVLCLFDPIMGWFFEDEHARLSHMCFHYREHGAGTQAIRFIHHPLLIIPRGPEARLIEQMMIDHGNVGFELRLVFPWYTQPRNVIKGVATILAISVLNDGLLCILTTALRKGPRSMITKTVLAWPLTALMLALACHLMARIYHGKHLVERQDEFVFCGIYCTCMG